VASYIVDHYWLRFDRGVVHVVVAGDIVDHYCLRFVRGVVHIVVASYIVDHFCLRFDRGVVHIGGDTSGVIRSSESIDEGGHHSPPSSIDSLLLITAVVSTFVNRLTASDYSCDVPLPQ
jgi:hypothetical protein